MSTLQNFRFKKKYSAENGEEGGGNRRHGKSGKDLILKVPEGTVIFEATTHKVITDMSGDNTEFNALPGGKGGKGNADMLRQDGARRGYDVIIVPPVKTETGEVVSSTLIRENLKQGHTAEAEKLMGHPLEINTAV